MSWGERALRIGGGLLGAGQTVKTEIKTASSAVNKLDDIFKHPPKPQAEVVTPEGLRLKVNVEENTFGKSVQSADDLNNKIFRQAIL